MDIANLALQGPGRVSIQRAGQRRGHCNQLYVRPSSKHQIEYQMRMAPLSWAEASVLGILLLYILDRSHVHW